MDLIAMWHKVGDELSNATSPVALSDDALVYDYIASRRTGDAQQESMDTDAVAWVRGVSDEIKRRGLYERAVGLIGCKHCGRPVDRAIEGEVVCRRCWAAWQMTDEDLAFEEEMRACKREMTQEVE